MPKSTTWITRWGVWLGATLENGIGSTIRSLGTGTTYQKIVGLDITINEVLFMDSLHASDLGEE